MQTVQRDTEKVSGYAGRKPKKKSCVSKQEEKAVSKTTEEIQKNLIQTLVKQAKKEKTDIVELLKEYVQVEVIV